MEIWTALSASIPFFSSSKFSRTEEGTGLNVHIRPQAPGTTCEALSGIFPQVNPHPLCPSAIPEQTQRCTSPFLKAPRSLRMVLSILPLLGVFKRGHPSRFTLKNMSHQNKCAQYLQKGVSKGLSRVLSSSEFPDDFEKCKFLDKSGDLSGLYHTLEYPFLTSLSLRSLAP